MTRKTQNKPTLIITLHPIRREDPLLLECQGETLFFNGRPLDLSAVTARKPLSRFDTGCDWLASDVRRVKGVLHLSILLPHGPDAPTASLYPDLITVQTDGPVMLPDYGSAG